MSQPLRIKSLEIESFKRIQFVRIVPDTSVTIIGGENRAGKSSALDAIEALFSGKGAWPAEPIHRGKRRARIKAELGKGKEVELTVELELSASGSAKLSVLGPDGEPIAKPQTFLNSLFSDISFDPLAFARMDPKEQDKVLKALDPETAREIASLDQERARLYAKRTGVNHQAESLEAQYKAAAFHKDAPAEETPASELSEQLETARAHNRARVAAQDRIDNASRKQAAVAEEIARIEEALKRAQSELQKACDELDAASKAFEALTPEADVTTLQVKLRDAEATNAQVRANKAKAKLKADHETTTRESQDLSDEIKAIDAKKQELLAAAKFPVPGLGFDELGPTYQGFPLDQASHSDRIKISAAIGMALHPQLGDLLIRDGEKVGSADMAIIRELAEREGFHVWIEKFTEKGEGCTVVLEDGRVRADQSAAE